MRVLTNVKRLSMSFAGTDVLIAQLDAKEKQRLEAEALALELAGMEQECHRCRGVGGQEEGAGVCECCHGTGSVFVFDDSVRVPCPDEGEDVGWKDEVHTEFDYRSF